MLPNTKHIFSKESNYISTFNDEKEFGQEIDLLIRKYVSLKYSEATPFLIKMQIQAAILPNNQKDFDEVSHMYLDIHVNQI